MSFDDFNFDARVMRGIKEMGFDTPTPIQEKAIPAILKGGDLFGLAQTGTGKTAAFALPIIQHLTKGKLRQIRALVVAPTRELAEQIHKTFVDLGKFTKVRSTPIYGGVGKKSQIDALKRGVEVLVACPGRLLDLANDGYVDFSKIEILVLDEADHMCDMGFLPDIKRILGKLPPHRQNLLFSATMPEDIKTLASQFLKNPETVQIGITAPAQTVSQAIFPITQGLKKKLLFHLLDQTATGQLLIFTRTKRRARFLALDLHKKGYKAVALQGNMSQNKRQAAIDGFRKGKFDILVATDIAARGIDVALLSHVINFDITDTVDAYTHRVGRTGRADASGEAFTFVTPDDEAMLNSIEQTLEKEIERRVMPDFNYGDFDPLAVLKYRPGRAPKKPKSSSNNNSQSRRPQRQNGNGRNQRSNGRKRRSHQKNRRIAKSS
ncbi:MAG: DEAD/DEAH box helicase [Chloroflexota bacterium]